MAKKNDDSTQDGEDKQDRIRFTSNPEDYGLDQDVRTLSHPKKELWERQERFLAGLAAIGTIRAGCRIAGISRRTQELWRKGNNLAFADRFDDAKQEYKDSLEDELDMHIKALKPGTANPLVLLARLNKEVEGYRQTLVLDDNTGKEILSRWAKRQSRDQKPVEQYEDKKVSPIIKMSDRRS